MTTPAAAPRTPRNGCHNRAPFKASTELRDHHGRLVAEWPFRMAPDCRYTHTELGQADALCHGCKWRHEAAAEAAQSSAIEVVVNQDDHILRRADGFIGDFIDSIVSKLIDAGIPAYRVPSRGILPVDVGVSRGHLVRYAGEDACSRVFRWVDDSPKPEH